MSNDNVNRNGFNATAATFTLPFSQTVNTFAPLPSNAAPYLSSAPFTYNYSNSSVPFTHVNNPSTFQQNNSVHAPMFMYNGSMPTAQQSYSSNLTADLTSQVAA